MKESVLNDKNMSEKEKMKKLKYMNSLDFILEEKNTKKK